MKNVLSKIFRAIFWVGIIGATVTIAVSMIAIIVSIINFATASDMPKPKVKNGEFQCKLVYEINGEHKVIEDTIVCKFDGYKLVGESGRYRQWKMYIKSTGKDMITLYDMRSNNDFTEWGNQILELCFDPGNAEYYMGDVGNLSRDGSKGEWIDYLYLTPKGEEGYSAFELDEAWEKYRIRIISWETSPPIQNTFK